MGHGIYLSLSVQINVFGPTVMAVKDDLFNAIGFERVRSVTKDRNQLA